MDSLSNFRSHRLQEISDMGQHREIVSKGMTGLVEIPVTEAPVKVQRGHVLLDLTSNQQERQPRDKETRSVGASGTTVPHRSVSKNPLNFITIVSRNFHKCESNTCVHECIAVPFLDPIRKPVILGSSFHIF